jgi:hypothetical protein
LPYALVPDGYKLRKVTKLQQEAISAKRSHDDAVALLANPNTPIVAGGAALIVATPFIIDKIVEFLKEEGEDIKDESIAILKSKLPTALALATGLGQQTVLSLESLLKGSLGRVI